MLKFLIPVRIPSEHHHSSPWFVMNWIFEIPWRNFHWRSCFERTRQALAVWLPPGAGQTASLCSRVVWPPPGADQTASLCSRVVWPPLGAVWPPTLPMVNFFENITIIIVEVWPRVVMWSNREMHRIFPTASFWSVGYIYSFISCKMGLMAISTAYLTPESHLLPHTSIPWSIVGVWDSSAWFECSWGLCH
jgi:hypothetical protein